MMRSKPLRNQHLDHVAEQLVASVAEELFGLRIVSVMRPSLPTITIASGADSSSARNLSSALTVRAREVEICNSLSFV